jgi:hypothetical protein
MGKKNVAKGRRKLARSATTNLPPRRLRDTKADTIKGGLLPARASFESTKNEVAIETLEIAHVGLNPRH